MRILNFINANARSSGPKLDSLVDCFDDMDKTLSVLTETWFQEDSTALANKLEDFGSINCLDVFPRTRTYRAANGRHYGGLAIITSKKNSNFKQLELRNPDDFEVMACIGKVTGFKEKVFVVGAYIPTNYTTTRATAKLEFISDVISEAKTRNENCFVILF